ncbi:MAG TPA: hypothetical protein VFC36_09140 [Paludibacter sp.]|nr:hypothetical protein [Paludibacter sp.]
MATIDWKSSAIFELLQRQVKDYNPLYNLIDICIAGQAAPISPVLNDVYYYGGDVMGTVFGIEWIPVNSFMVFGTEWSIAPISAFLTKKDDGLIFSNLITSFVPFKTTDARNPFMLSYAFEGGGWRVTLLCDILIIGKDSQFTYLKSGWSYLVPFVNGMMYIDFPLNQGESTPDKIKVSTGINFNSLVENNYRQVLFFCATSYSIPWSYFDDLNNKAFIETANTKLDKLDVLSNDLTGDKIYNRYPSYLSTSADDIYLDSSSRISMDGVLLSLSINIAELSLSESKAWFYIVHSSNFDVFKVIRTIEFTPIVGINEVNLLDQDILLHQNDYVVWGGYHTIKYTNSNFNSSGWILPTRKCLVGEIIQGDVALPGFNFGIIIKQKVNYNNDFLNLLEKTLPKTLIIDHSINLIDITKVTVGTLVGENGTFGVISSGPNGWFTTDYTEIFGATKVILKNADAAKVCFAYAFYNIDRVYIQNSYRFVLGNGWNWIADCPIGAKYIAMTLTNTGGWMLNEGDVPLPYEAYSYKFIESYLADKDYTGKKMVFKPDVNDPDLLAVIGKGDSVSIILPKSIYTVCNDNVIDAYSTRNYSVSLYLDHLLKLSAYRELRFKETNTDKIPIYSKLNSFGVLSGGGRGFVFNEDGSMVKQSIKRFHISGDISNIEHSINHVSTLNSATKAKTPIILCIGDSVTEGYNISDSNKPFADAPGTYWQFIKTLFDFDAKDIADTTKFKSLLVGSHNVRTCTGRHPDGDILNIRACAEGRGGGFLSEYLRNITVGNSPTPNVFYDGTKAGVNKFSILKWLSDYRTLLDDGVTRCTSGNKGTLVGDVNAFDVCKPTHVIIQIGYNDGNYAGYIDDINALMDIIQAEIPGCFIGLALPDCSGTYFPEFYPEYGADQNDAYPVSHFFGECKTSHDTFYDMTVRLMTAENTALRRFYIPTYFIGPTAQAAPYRESNEFVFQSTGLQKNKLLIQTDSAPNLHSNNHAHAAWGYEMYAWIKYTLTI